MPIIPSLQRQRQILLDQKFKTILDYIVSLRPTWTILDRGQGLREELREGEGGRKKRGRGREKKHSNKNMQQLVLVSSYECFTSARP